MPMNIFASQKEALFITYHDVIKTPKFLILKRLLTDEYKNNYKDYIDFSKIENLTDDQLYGEIFAAKDINILKALSTNKFDYDATYLDLYLNYENIIHDSKLLSFGIAIHILLKQNFLNKIYIYTPFYDENIYKDICDTYASPNIIYTHGNLNEVINEISDNVKITSFVLNDINLIHDLIDMRQVAYTNILVCNAGWNYKPNPEKDTLMLKFDGIDKIAKEQIFKVGLFDPNTSSSYDR